MHVIWTSLDWTSVVTLSCLVPLSRYQASSRIMHIDLPPFILVHAVGLVALGCKMLFFDRPSAAPLGVTTSAIGFCCECRMLLCRISNKLIVEDVDLFTAYVPQEVVLDSLLGQGKMLSCKLIEMLSLQSNVFLHASGPVRMLLACLAGTKLLLSPSTRRSPERNVLLGVMLYDGLGGLHLCWWLKNFTGLAPASVYA